MQTIEELEKQFANEPVSFGKRGELDTIRVENRFASFEMTFHGAHALSYAPRGGEDLLMVSRESNFAPGKPIRGGVPVCWPWFGPYPADAIAPAHGYARLARWELFAVRTLPTGETRLLLRLDRSTVPAGIPQLEAEAEFIATVGAKLELELITYNTSPGELAITEALHSYFAIDDVSQLEITGLEDTLFLDKLDGGEKIQRGAIAIDREVDRIYLDTASDVTISDHSRKRRIVVSKAGSLSTVVWNPWIEKARRLADFGDDEYGRMVCVETVHAARDSRVVAPGGRLSLKTVIEGGML